MKHSNPSSIAKEKCKEYWDKIPASSDHLWQGDHHGLPSGRCQKCDMPYWDYHERFNAWLESKGKNMWVKESLKSHNPPDKELRDKIRLVFLMFISDLDSDNRERIVGDYVDQLLSLFSEEVGKIKQELEKYQCDFNWDFENNKPKHKSYIALEDVLKVFSERSK